MTKPVTMTRLGIILAMAAAALVACGNSGSKAKGMGAVAAAASGGTATAAMVSYSGPDKILTSDAASRTVMVNLIAGEGTAANGFNFNGYANGYMHIQVPTGWTVKVSMVVESNTPHSALIVPWDERKGGGTLHPAFASSAGSDFRSGIEKGDDPEKLTFAADKAGEYAIVCGVPGHIDAGMWDAFDVVDNLAAPQVLVKQ